MILQINGFSIKCNKCGTNNVVGIFSEELGKAGLRCNECSNEGLEL